MAVDIESLKAALAIARDIEPLHDADSRVGDSKSVVTHLRSNTDWTQWQLILPVENEEIYRIYSGGPFTLNRLKEFIHAVATSITGDRDNSIEKAMRVCIGELIKANFNGQNPYMITEQTPPDYNGIKIKIDGEKAVVIGGGHSAPVLRNILDHLGTQNFYLEAFSGSAIHTLKNAGITEPTLSEIFVPAATVDPGASDSNKTWRHGAITYTSESDPVFGTITCEGLNAPPPTNQVKIRFEHFPDIVLDKLPSTCLATVIAALIPNIMREATEWSPRVSAPSASVSNSQSSQESAGPSQDSDKSGTSAASAASAAPPLPQFEEYLLGSSSNGADQIETHIKNWRGTVKTDKLLKFLIFNVGINKGETTEKGKQERRAELGVNPSYHPGDNIDKLADWAKNRLQAAIEEEKVVEGAGGGGGGEPPPAKRVRSSCSSECDIKATELKQMCNFALDILDKCIKADGMNYQYRVQTAIKAILSLKSWGDRLQLDQLMKHVDISDRNNICAVASCDKGFLAMCGLEAIIQSRKLITVEVNDRTSLLIINYNTNPLTDEERRAQEEARTAAAAEAERVAAEEAKAAALQSRITALKNEAVRKRDEAIKAANEAEAAADKAKDDAERASRPTTRGTPLQIQLNTARKSTKEATKKRELATKLRGKATRISALIPSKRSLPSSKQSPKEEEQYKKIIKQITEIECEGDRGGVRSWCTISGGFRQHSQRKSHKNHKNRKSSRHTRRRT